MNVKDDRNTNGLGGQSDSLCQMLLQAHEVLTEAKSRALKAPLVLATAGGIGDLVPIEAPIATVGRAGR
ncbi:DUF2783 domain-containing protein [Oceaniradius stylonematis]|uniref:DUF2783 domain-containing protein n=1 Tax=Oceaniradius stylonematis TaxID=2184161 RepID=UPI00273E2D80|nr:DUF2783 domain-containing protein [Oceaniradius stylonematis]